MYNKKQTFFISLLLFLFLLPSKIDAAIVINEIMPNPAGDDKELEWVELYNSDHNQISVDGYVLEDKNGKRITLSGSFSDWFVVNPKGEHGFALTNSGSTIKLFTASTSAEPIDSFTYSDSDDNDSWGRILDGGSVISLVSATKGSGNVPTPAPTQSPTPTPKPPPAGGPTPKKTIAPTVKPETNTPPPSPTIKASQSQSSSTTFKTPVTSEETKESSESGIVLSAQDSNSDLFQNQKPSESFQSRKISAPLLVSLGGVLLVMGGCLALLTQYKRQSREF